MKSLSSVGVGLSVMFGLLFLALVVKIYYLLWWKKRVTGRVIEDDDGNPAREILYIFCCKSKKLRSTTLTSQELRISVDNQSENGLQLHTNKDLYLFDENCLEAGFLMGPPRFLFTIKEETKEDLESEDDKSKKLSDLMRNDDTPYMTPLSSPALFTPPLTPSMGSSHSNGYNPFYESSSDVEFIKMKSSPPPRFKFLRDAEEKLRRKNTVEEDKRENSMSSSNVSSTINTSNSGLQKGEGNVSHVIILVADKDIEQYNSPQSQSSSSPQVLPLASSTFSLDSSIPDGSSIIT